jgi:hypothetical protein
VNPSGGVRGCGAQVLRNCALLRGGTGRERVARVSARVAFPLHNEQPTKN